jgi:hypothetical protein
MDAEKAAGIMMNFNLPFLWWFGAIIHVMHEVGCRDGEF